MIYCVEDDKNIRDLVVYALRTGGFAAEGFPDAESFYAELKKANPELVLLDIMLPSEDGMSVLARLKSRKETKAIPVVMLTAKAAEYDKVQGLDLGADDYIVKPFGVMELLARVRAVLRRSGAIEEAEHKLAAGGIVLDLESHQSFAEDKEIELTYKEFELLQYLLENRGIVLSREKLLKAIWGYDFEGETRTVDVHIGNLRQKLGACGNQIETVRGIGYRIGGEK
ncbi:MAG: response regulator transcription factor [Eubacteriales bacterium]|nr:response regulator transcription factor [Eubacteriales bacterium]MDD3350208.1 response regulator transcription factor [Eubacteriales bacterium]